jgi:hypothetical protein
MRAYCFACGADTIVTKSGVCSWCDERIAQPATKSRYPTGRKSYIGTEEFYRAAYEAYLERRSLRSVCKDIWQEAGYSSLKSCHNSLWEVFRARGWQMYTRSYARTKHGLARRGRVDPAHRRRMRIQRGEMSGKRCAGVRRQYPNKGAACKRYASAGSDYCWSHDPKHHAHIAKHLDELRQRQHKDTPSE